MSLTTFIRQKPVHDELMKHIKVPKFEVPWLMLPRLTTPKRAAYLGTAFDYALRFWLERKYKGKIFPKKYLVAEHGLHMTNIVWSAVERRNYEAHILDAKKYLLTDAPAIDNKFVAHCFQLAHLDQIYRQARKPQSLVATVTNNEIVDIKRLLKQAISVWPEVKYYCFLNPTFGIASELVGGADADIIQDAMLVDIKCVVKVDLAEILKQLVGYAVLVKISGEVDELSDKSSDYPLVSIGVYLARHGIFKTWLIEEIISPKSLEHLARFFVEQFEDEDDGYPGEPGDYGDIDPGYMYEWPGEEPH